MLHGDHSSAAGSPPREGQRRRQGVSPKHCLLGSSYPDPGATGSSRGGPALPQQASHGRETRLSARTQTQTGTRQAHMPPGATQSGPRHRGREAGPSYLSAPCTAQAHLQTLATGFSPSVPLPAPHLEHGGGGRGSAEASSVLPEWHRAALLALSRRVWNQLQATLREHHVLPPAPPPPPFYR